MIEVYIAGGSAVLAGAVWVVKKVNEHDTAIAVLNTRLAGIAEDAQDAKKGIKEVDRKIEDLADYLLRSGR